MPTELAPMQHPLALLPAACVSFPSLNSPAAISSEKSHDFKNPTLTYVSFILESTDVLQFNQHRYFHASIWVTGHGAEPWVFLPGPEHGGAFRGVRRVSAGSMSGILYTFWVGLAHCNVARFMLFGVWDSLYLWEKDPFFLR